MSLGGHLILLNSVVNVIPIIYLSILKMFVKVWKKIVKFQRKFMWGGVRGGIRSLGLGGLMFVSPRSSRALVFVTFGWLT